MVVALDCSHIQAKRGVLCGELSWRAFDIPVVESNGAFAHAFVCSFLEPQLLFRRQSVRIPEIARRQRCGGLLSAHMDLSSEQAQESRGVLL